MFRLHLSLMQGTFLAAGAAYLLGMAAVLARLLIVRGRAELPTRKLAGQEIIWTVVPALVLVGLAVVAAFPHQEGKGPASPPASERAIRSE